MNIFYSDMEPLSQYSPVTLHLSLLLLEFLVKTLLVALEIRKEYFLQYLTVFSPHLTSPLNALLGVSPPDFFSHKLLLDPWLVSRV